MERDLLYKKEYKKKYEKSKPKNWGEKAQIW